jgi:hypothetical protein
VITEYFGVPKVVVFRTYGDYFITAPVVPSNEKPEINEVKKELYLLKISEMSGKPIRIEKLGKLKAKQ